MTLPEQIIGFDGSSSTDDVVVLARTPGGQWRIVHPEPADTSWIPAAVERGMAVQHTGLARQVSEWLARHCGEHVELSDWQVAMVERAYSFAGFAGQAAAGRITHEPAALTRPTFRP